MVWVNRAIGVLSLALAALCLYLALSQLTERIFTERLIEKLNAKGILSTWVDIK